MKREELHSRILGFIELTISLMGLIGCTSDETAEPVKVKTEAEVQLTGYVTGFEEAQGVTRTWTPPTGYSTLDNISDKNISVFLTQVDVPDGGFEEEFFFQRGDKWLVSNDMTPQGIYYIYGYIPHDRSIKSSIEPLSGKTYADGAKLTLENLPAITTNDICVIVGAKNGKSADDDYGLTTGQFKYVSKELKDPGPGDYGNFVFLLFDHLYSSINVSFSVDKNYNKLRTIKLKKVELQAMVLDNNNVKTELKRKTKAVITLRKKTDGTSPLIYNNTEQIVFTPDATSGKADEPLFDSAEGQALTTDFSDFTGCFMSQGISDFTIRSTYDVYDKNVTTEHPEGNLIRENCVAENKVNIQQLFSTIITASRGIKYTVKLIVNPTYLYVLSEPDLDNPTITLE